MRPHVCVVLFLFVFLVVTRLLFTYHFRIDRFDPMSSKTLKSEHRGALSVLRSQHNSEKDKMTTAGEDNRPVFSAHKCNTDAKGWRHRCALKPHLSQLWADGAARLMELRAEAVSSAFCSHGAPTNPGDSIGNTNKVVRGHQTAGVNRSIHAGCCHQRYLVHRACKPRSSREELHVSKTAFEDENLRQTMTSFEKTDLLFACIRRFCPFLPSPKSASALPAASCSLPQ